MCCVDCWKDFEPFPLLMEAGSDLKWVGLHHPTHTILFRCKMIKSLYLIKLNHTQDCTIQHIQFFSDANVMDLIKITFSEIILQIVDEKSKLHQSNIYRNLLTNSVPKTSQGINRDLQQRAWCGESSVQLLPIIILLLISFSSLSGILTQVQEGWWHSQGLVDAIRRTTTTRQPHTTQDSRILLKCFSHPSLKDFHAMGDIHLE